MAETVYTLPSSWYTDPAHFAAEEHGLFRKTWHFACHRSELSQPGDYVAVDIGNQSIFCILDREGVVRAFHNVCQHRAHHLVEGSGRCKLIVCPYHAWTYELSGELRGGPNLIAASFDRTDIRLRGIKVEDFLGFLFVNLDPDAAPMDEWYPKAREELAAYVPNHASLAPLTWISVDERCNWKVSAENYSECYHCARNHETFANGVIQPATYDIQPQGHCLRHTTECQNLDAMTYPIDLNANEFAGKYSSWYLWPFFSFQVYPGNVLNTYHWRPNAVDAVTVVRGWYTEEGAESAVVRNLANQDRITTVEEDISLVESVQRGLTSCGYDQGPLLIDPAGGVQSEHSIAAMHRWAREFA